MKKILEIDTGKEKKQIPINIKRNFTFNVKTGIAEVDTDGVLGNTDGAYRKYIKHIIPDFSEEKYIDDWGMPKVKNNYPEAFNIVMNLWKNYDFMRNLERFEDVETGMQLLTDLIPNVIVHTHILSEEAAVARREWLEELMIDSDTNFDIDICLDKTKKSLPNPYITIEDNIKNLNNSSAQIKILIRRCHNRNVKLEDIENGSVKMICDSFFDAALALTKLYQKYQGSQEKETIQMKVVAC